MERIILVGLTKRQLDILFFAVTEDAVCQEYDEKEVLPLVDLLGNELNQAVSDDCMI